MTLPLKTQGRLLYGIEYQGKLYFDFEVSLLSLFGECRVAEVLEDLELEKQEYSDTTRNMLIDLAYLGQQLVVQGIPQTVLSPAFLLHALVPADYDILGRAIGELRKKRVAVGERAETVEIAGSELPLTRQD